MARKRMISREEACMLFSAIMVSMVALLSASSSQAKGIGVNYGRVANNLPNPKAVVQFVVSQGIGKAKIYDADSTVIQAFANTHIQLIIGLPNEQLSMVAADPNSAYDWVKQNVSAHYPATQIVGIAVGNEVLTSAPALAGTLLQAMNNLHSALVSLKLDNVVKVSSPHSMAILENSYPPSAGQFNATYATSVLQPFFNFLVVTNSFAMVNVYPFFAYSSNPAQVPLTYALFLPTQVVMDPNSGLQYLNLFDAQVDAFYSAMTALNNSFINMTITVTETGWPSQGDAAELGANIPNAASYNGNLVKNIVSGRGTPLKPNVSIEAYVFALFNEDQKPGPTSERNYGLFYPNMKQVYSLNFSTGEISGTGNEKGGPVPVPGAQPAPQQPAPTFCVAKSDAPSSLLQRALDYACGLGGADCEPLQPGQACFIPNTLWAHASYAFNSYYQKNERSSVSCNFGGSAVVNATAPSTDTCTYPTE